MMSRLAVYFAFGLGLVQPIRLVGQSPNTQDQNRAPSSKLTNKDVLEMHTAGLSDDLITEKIKTSICDFDTSPSALVQFKTVGVSESVALAMMRCPSAPPTSTLLSPSISSADPKALYVEKVSPNAPSGYTFTYVKSSRKWKLSLNSEPFNKVSEDF